MASGVRNLRAMFEQNKEGSALTPPDDRGRSPGDSTGVPHSAGTSPRPLSTVRTSFVTVERNSSGQLGLRREPSADTASHAGKKGRGGEEGETRHAPTEMDARTDQTTDKTGMAETGPPGGEPGTKEKKTQDATVEKRPAASVTSNGLKNGSKPAEKATSKMSSKPPPITSTNPTTSPQKTSPKKPKDPAPKAPKTPTTPKMPRSKELPTKTPERKPEKNGEKKAGGTSMTSTKPASKPVTTAAHGAAATTKIPPSPPQTGFVKPRPRSPTRPVKLPASLTAHTASSGSKTAAGGGPPVRQSLSRASGNAQSTTLQAPRASARPASRASTTTAKSTTAHKPSTLKNGSHRPALGPPPPNPLKKQPSRQSLPPGASADEGFLARMMRPTTASASKTADKSDTPPKRSQSVKRSVPKDGLPSKPTLAVGSPASRKVRKVVSPVRTTQASSKAPVKGKEPKPESKEPVPIKKVETPAMQQATVEPSSGPAEMPVAETKSEPEGEEPTPVDAEATQAEKSVAKEEAAVEQTPGVAEEQTADAEPAKEDAAEEGAAVEDAPAPVEKTTSVSEPAQDSAAEEGVAVEDKPGLVEDKPGSVEKATSVSEPAQDSAAKEGAAVEDKPGSVAEKTGVSEPVKLPAAEEGAAVEDKPGLVEEKTSLPEPVKEDAVEEEGAIEHTSDAVEEKAIVPESTKEEVQVVPKSVEVEKAETKPKIEEPTLATASSVADVVNESEPVKYKPAASESSPEVKHEKEKVVEVEPGSPFKSETVDSPKVANSDHAELPKSGDASEKPYASEKVDEASEKVEIPGNAKDDLEKVDIPKKVDVPEKAEDPADIAAREEMARINAEFKKSMGLDH